MSELKAYIGPAPDEKGLADYYFKSEADKVIAELKNEIEVKKRLLNMALASVPNALKVMKIIQHHKYKRCLDNAWWCRRSNKAYAWSASNLRGWKIAVYYDKKAELYRKWHKRWLKIAEQFKEAKLWRTQTNLSSPSISAKCANLTAPQQNVL